MTNRERVVALVAALTGLAVFAGTNGIWIVDNSTYAWSTASGCWRYGTVADGGVMTFWSCPANLNIDVDTVRLEGILRTGMRATSFTNTVNGIQFVGEPSFLINHSSALTMKGPLIGTGANRLEIGGMQGVVFENLASNFGEVAVIDANVKLTATSGTIFSHDTVTVGDGAVNVAPALTEGETAELSMCDGEGRHLGCGPGLGRLMLNHGSGSGVTLTVPSIVVGNGALCVDSATSLSALGAADKLLVTTPPAVENGMITPAIAVYDSTGTSSGYFRGSFFATYDGANGVVPAAGPVAWNAAADQSTTIVRLAADAMVDAPKSVYAMYWDVAANRTLTLNDVLKVLSGGLIVNCTADASATGMKISGAGALDFGDQQGVIRGSSLGVSSYKNVDIAVNAPIKGTRGVLFSGTPAVLNGNFGCAYNYTLNQPAAWTGPTVIANGVKLIVPNSVGAEVFPAGGDVYVAGGDHRNGASIRMTESATFDQNFLIAGAGTGSHSSGNCGPFHLGGIGTVITFNGATRFQNTVYFSHDNSAYVMKFVGRVSGAGRIDMHYGTLEFAGENDYNGAIDVSAKGGTIVVSGDGTLGRASVNITNGDLKFNDLNGQTIPNDIISTGTITVDGGHVVLTGHVKTAKTILKNGAILEIGDDVDLGQVTFQNCSKVVAASGATRARIEIGGDGVSDGDLSNALAGDSDVVLVKTGTNTVALSKACPFGGEMTIAEGTVKLVPGLLATATMWLDASRTDTITAEDGKATKWRSANGNGCVFTSATDSGGVPGTYPGAAMNGHDTMYFEHNGTNYTWFVCDRSIDIRSIYVCMKPYFLDPETPVTLTPWGWYGKGSPEYGLRWATYSTWHDLNFTSSKKRVNGGKTTTPARPDGIPLIIGQFNADDSELLKTMTPSIGGYQTWGRTDNCYNGEIAEVISFDHELSEDEKKMLEQYLSVKWGVYDAAGIWPEVDTQTLTGGSVLADTASLTLVSGAVLDLNGADQTIASLAGVGLITNSAAGVALLKVTGACDFNGVVAANVRLETSGTVRGEVNGELIAKGATVTLTDAVVAPPAEGRLWWFDASEVTEISATASTAGSIKTNGYGRVERWYAKGDAGTYFYSENGGGGDANYAEYKEKTDGVAPGLYMDANVRIVCNQANTPYTIAVVYEFDATLRGASYFFCGYGFGDSSMRVYSNGSLDTGFNFLRSASFSNYGDSVYVNGTRYEAGVNAITLPMGGLCCYIGTRNPTHTDTNWVNRKFCVGSSCWSKGTYGTKVCEAICYDRLLSDDECRALNSYLTEKWSGSGLSVRKAAIGTTAVLGAKNGATLDIRAAAPATVAKLVSDTAGGTIVGDITASGFEYDAENAATVQPLVVDGALTLVDGSDFKVLNSRMLTKAVHTLLTADSATGTFATWDVGETSLKYQPGSAKWSLGPRGLVVIMR